MRQIEFRGQIVQAYDRPLPLQLSEQARLGEHASQSRQLFLTTGKVFPLGRQFVSDGPVSPMTSRSGVSSAQVSPAQFRERISKSPVFSPASTITELYSAKFGQKARNGTLDMRAKQLKVSKPHGIDLLACLREFCFPWFEQLSRYCAPGAQEAVPLLQGPLVPAPRVQETVFHVEHAPIKITAAFLSATGDQCVRTRFKTNYRALTDHFSQGCGLPIKSGLPTRTLTPQPRAPYPTVFVANLCVHRQRSRSALQQGFLSATAKRAPMGQQKCSLQHACLSRAVGPDKGVDSLTQGQIDVRQAAKPANPQTFELHRQNTEERTPERLSTAPALEITALTRWARIDAAIRGATA